MTKTLTILILITTLIGFKSHQSDNNQLIHDTINFITHTKWNIDLSDIDSLSVYNHSTLYFIQDYIYFHNDKIGSFEIKNDSLIVKEVYYQQTKDSLIRKENLKLIAKILHIDHDSLVIEKIKGRGFYFVYGGNYKYYPQFNHLRFYNDTLNFSKRTDFNKICLSSSLCYGNCPSQAIEISSDGEYKFFGGKYSKLSGYFYGKLSIGFIDTLKMWLSASILNRDNLSFTEAVDAPVCDMKIIFNNDSIDIHGCPYYFPFRLRELYNLIMDSYGQADLIKTDKSIEFETKSHIYDTTVIEPPPPPTYYNDYFIEDSEIEIDSILNE